MDRNMTCKNPFFRCRGKHSSDIAVIIMYKGEEHPICKECWRKIADSDIEWGKPEPEPYYGPFPQKTKLHHGMR